MMTDPIADMLTRIRNASAVRKERVVVPYSRMKKGIADVLKAEGYIKDYETLSEGPFRNLSLMLEYSDETTPAIQAIKRISKPGCRIYTKAEELPVVLRNYGIAILSTSRGIMTNRQAKKLRLGGEIICEVH